MGRSTHDHVTGTRLFLSLGGAWERVQGEREELKTRPDEDDENRHIQRREKRTNGRTLELLRPDG